MSRIPLVLSALLSIILLLSGGVLAFLNLVWSVEWGYVVDVAAPDGVTWTLWVPDPGVSMPWTATGDAAVMGTVESLYGPRVNLSGTGTARVRFSNTTTLIGVDPLIGLPPALRLLGGEGAGSSIIYRIWRRSSDPSANLTLTGGLRFDAKSPVESWTCRGSGFEGHPEEGWHPLPIVLGGDCVQAFVRLQHLLTLTLIGVGSFLTGISVAAWRRRPTVSR